MNARQPKGPLHRRPEEMTAAFNYFLHNRLPIFAAEVSFRQEAQLVEALKREFPSIAVKLFLPEEHVSLAVLTVAEASIVERLLQQDWMLKLDASQLAFGHPAKQ